jgi:ribonuclease HI
MAPLEGRGKKSMEKLRVGSWFIGIEKRLHSLQEVLGPRTNNEAEYEAVIAGLLICSMADLVDPIIYTDSAVVANQVNGKWRCKNSALVPLLMTIEEIREEYNFQSSSGS